MPEHSYHALYYPFIHFKDDRWLKTSALYWDRMARIVPHSYVREDSDTVRALGSYIENLHPEYVRPSFGKRFSAFVARHGKELGNRYGVKLRQQWPRILERLRPPTPGGSSGTDPRLSYVYYEKMSDDVQRVMLDSGLTLHDPVDRGWIGMHPRLAHVYMTALASQLAAERGHYPLTDDALDHVSVGGSTIERLAQALLTDVDIVDADAGRDEVESATVFVALRTVLPADIDALPVKRILRFRDKYPAERAQFQRYLAKFANSREWLKRITDPQVLASRIESEIDKEMKPKLKELREKHREFGIDTVYGVLSMQIGVPAAVATAAKLAGVAVEPALALGTGAALAIVPVLRERQKAKRELIASDVSYLMRIQRNLKPRDVIGRIREAARRFLF